MKVIHCNTTTRSGGAAIAAMRLHHALRNEGVESLFAVAQSETEQSDIIPLYEGKRKKLYSLLRISEIAVLRALGARKNYLFSPALLPSFVHRQLNSLKPDIFHLHWLANAFMPIASLSKLATKTVWTMHDEWAFTGGCHYCGGCEQYNAGCNECPLVPKALHFIVRESFKRKKNVYSMLKPVIVCPSKAFSERAQNSLLLHGLQHKHIPNAIDTDSYLPLQKDAAKKKLGIPQNESVIAFGAIGATSDNRKGYDLLLRSLSHLREYYSGPIRLLVFGATADENLQCCYPTLFLGHLNCDSVLCDAYNAADVFVCPSREDNLPNTVMEALSCGIPVAAFAVGGIPDMVIDGENGCLATPNQPEALGRRIAYILEDTERNLQMAENARNSVVTRYSMSVVAQSYLRLYEDMLDFS